MPKTDDGGWLLDDSPIFTPEEWAQIQQLLKAGKKDEAQKMIDEILSRKEPA
jgi:hypothetical protein